jgi:hypothetical protein
MSWTTPRDLEAQVGRLWKRGRLLAAERPAEDPYPLRLNLKRPAGRELSSRFDEVRRWIRELEQGSRAVRGYGYEIAWTEINHRELGRNRVPAAALVPSAEDALRLIGKTRDARRFHTLCEQTLSEFPTLGSWLTRRPLALLEHADEWPRILSVLRWFQAHLRPQLYLRQLEIADVDSKFIEHHRGLLIQLLDRVLPESALDPKATGSRGFERRYGLRAKPAMVRFRVLDQGLAIAGLTDLTVPVSELAALRLPVARAFVTENEVNGLAFPELPQSLVVFGLGYGIDLLFEVPWLRNLPLYYWGDIDTHGFAMLERLRTVFPQTRSLLMDRETLLGHKRLWVHEHKPHRGTLDHLTADEQALYQDLQTDRLGTGVRLEQERVSYTRLREALGTLA